MYSVSSELEVEREEDKKKKKITTLLYFICCNISSGVEY